MGCENKSFKIGFSPIEGKNWLITPFLPFYPPFSPLLGEKGPWGFYLPTLDRYIDMSPPVWREIIQLILHLEVKIVSIMQSLCDCNPGGWRHWGMKTEQRLTTVLEAGERRPSWV